MKFFRAQVNYLMSQDCILVKAKSKEQAKRILSDNNLSEEYFDVHSYDGYYVDASIEVIDISEIKNLSIDDLQIGDKFSYNNNKFIKTDDCIVVNLITGETQVFNKQQTPLTFFSANI